MSESMTIPEGLSCGDCRMYAKCAAIIGMKSDSTECDFFPVKFVASHVALASLKRDCAALRAELETTRADWEHSRQKWQIEIGLEIAKHARTRAELQRAGEDAARLRQLVKRIVEADKIDWHEWSCRSTWVNGTPCDCGGAELEAEARAVAELAAHDALKGQP